MGELRSSHNYEIIKLLAQNAYSQLYHARSRDSKAEEVVIKLWPTAYVTTEAQRIRIQQEFEALLMLKNPHILPVKIVIIEQLTITLITEYAPNGSLHDRLRLPSSQPLPLAEALTLIKQVARALEAAHQQHVFHGNLTTHNILFNATNQAVLTDFRLASIQAAVPGMLDENAPSRWYMAPEQFQGTINAHSDQYALGCLAYQLLTGHVPFTGSARSTLQKKHETRLPERLSPSIPHHIEKAVFTALAKLPAERFEDVQAFLTALEQPAKNRAAIVLSGKATSTYKPGSSGPAHVIPAQPISPIPASYTATQKPISDHGIPAQPISPIPVPYTATQKPISHPGLSAALPAVIPLTPPTSLPAVIPAGQETPSSTIHIHTSRYRTKSRPKLLHLTVLAASIHNLELRKRCQQKLLNPILLVIYIVYNSRLYKNFQQKYTRLHPISLAIYLRSLGRRARVQHKYKLLNYILFVGPFHRLKFQDEHSQNSRFLNPLLLMAILSILLAIALASSYLLFVPNIAPKQYSFITPPGNFPTTTKNRPVSFPPISVSSTPVIASYVNPTTSPVLTPGPNQNLTQTPGPNQNLTQNPTQPPVQNPTQPPAQNPIQPPVQNPTQPPVQNPVPTTIPIPTPRPVPTPTPTPIPQAVVQPHVACIVHDGTSTGFNALFGYTNTSSDFVTITSPSQNLLLPVELNGSQPTTFAPGSFSFAFSVHSSSAPVTWLLSGIPATATNNSPTC